MQSSDGSGEGRSVEFGSKDAWYHIHGSRKQGPAIKTLNEEVVVR